MSDIAQLGIKVATQGVVEANRQLDQLDSNAGKAERSVHALGASAAKWLSGGIALGITALSAATAKYVQNTIAAEKVQAQLEARLKSTAGVAGLTLEMLNKQAGALQDVSIFDDESIGEAQALLLTFTKIGSDVFPRATEAVLDMSTALGSDLKSAALQVGKALNDPVLGVTALSRAGVQFSESQKETIKKLVDTNRVAEAQVIVLKELETQMGGAARAARDTLGGAVEGLKNAFDNLLEGDAGEGGVVGTREAIESLTATLNDPGIKRGVDATANGMITIANAAVQLIAKLGEAGSALAEFFASNERKGDISLKNRRTDLETRLFRAQRQQTTFFGRAAGIFGDDPADLKKEIGDIDRILAQRESARLFDDVRSGVSGQIRGKGAATASDDDEKPKKRAAAVKELSAAEKALQDIMQVNALIDEEAADSARSLFFERQAAAEKAAEEAKQRMEFNTSLVTDMQFELSLLTMTNEERAKAIALRRLEAGATEEQRKAVANLAVSLEQANERKQEVDRIKADLSELFVDVITGAKSATDGIKEFFDTLARRQLQRIANKWIDRLVDGLFSGGDGGGSLPGFSSGGYTGDGGKYEPAGIVHKGEYVLDADTTRMLGRGYLDRLSSGGTPESSQPKRVNQHLTQTFIVQGTPDRRTREQLAREAGREARRGMARSG